MTTDEVEEFLISEAKATHNVKAALSAAATSNIYRDERKLLSIFPSYLKSHISWVFARGGFYPSSYLLKNLLRAKNIHIHEYSLLKDYLECFREQ